MPHFEVNLMLGIFPLMLSLYTHLGVLRHHTKISCGRKLSVIIFLIFKYKMKQILCQLVLIKTSNLCCLIFLIFLNGKTSNYGYGDLRYLCILCHRSTQCNYYYYQ